MNLGYPEFRNLSSQHEEQLSYFRKHFSLGSLQMILIGQAIIGNKFDLSKSFLPLSIV